MQEYVRRVRWAGPSLGLLVGVVAGLGCWVRADHHCSNLDGDATCAARGGGSFCDLCQAEGDGCTDARPRPECHFAGAEPEGASVGASAYEETTTPTEGSGGSLTTGAVECTSDAGCGDPAAPFCAPDGTCVACDGMSDPDAACAGLDPTMPACADGECVQCSEVNATACDATLRICDPEAHACAACTAHEQCASEACALLEGRCFPPGVISLEVDGDGNADHSTVTAAVASIANGEMGIIRIHERDGGEAYPSVLVIDGGKTIALLAAAGEQPSLRGVFGGDALRVDGSGTTAYLDRIWLRGSNAGRGLVVGARATAWVDRSHIVQNAGGGVLAEADASVTIRSSFVGSGDVAEAPVVEVGEASASIVYSTLGGGLGSAHALRCAAAAAVDVRNSVLVARTNLPEIDCEATFERSAAELDLGGTNVALGPMSALWFTGYLQGDFSPSHQGAGVLAGIARWREGDPRVDIDGEPRPTGADGVSDHAGADVP